MNSQFMALHKEQRSSNTFAVAPILTHTCLELNTLKKASPQGEATAWTTKNLWPTNKAMGEEGSNPASMEDSIPIQESI